MWSPLLSSQTLQNSISVTASFRDRSLWGWNGPWRKCARRLGQEVISLEFKLTMSDMLYSLSSGFATLSSDTTPNFDIERPRPDDKLKHVGHSSLLTRAKHNLKIEL